MPNSISRAPRPSRHPGPPAANSAWLARLPAPSRKFLEELVGLRLVSASGVDPFLEARADRLNQYRGEVEIGQALIDADLLTSFQLDRVLAGQSHGLVLGNYRIQQQIGSGGMGLVYLGEHLLMRRRVAVKVLPVDDACHVSLRQRFYAEMRLLAELNHPNIVQAFDASELPAVGPNMPALVYLVMELIENGDLEQHVERHGPPAVAQACAWIAQAAQGLQAAHDLHVVHRDVKPSNLLICSRGLVKLVDFGLARQFCSQLTDPRALLGSVEFMAPEQSHDPSAVGPEADVYGLASTLFWLLTAQAPYPFRRNVGAALRALQHEAPRRLKDLRPDVPPELDLLVDRMLNRDPRGRPTPAEVGTALAPFTVASSAPPRPVASGSRAQILGAHATATSGRRRVLLVDEPAARAAMRRMLDGCCTIDEADNGEAALARASAEPFDLVLLDLGLPGLDGREICRRLRQQHPTLRIVVVSGAGEAGLAEALAGGADDFLARPVSAVHLRARVESTLRLKEELDRTRAVAEQLRRTNEQLALTVEARKADVRNAHDALLYAMARMAESRDGETAGHLKRMQRYALVLAEGAAREHPWAGLVDARFLEQLERCMPLHDIGKIGLPDDILLKPAALTAAERKLVETHPATGDRMLEALGREYGMSLDFLGTARAIVRHHHERFDGTGYPDRLAGDAIPAVARLAAIADVYDALRRERLHKPAMSHNAAVHVLLHRSPGHFDPTLLRVFTACHDRFEKIYREIVE